MGNLDNQENATSKIEALVDINNKEWQELATKMKWDNTNEAIKESIRTLDERGLVNIIEKSYKNGEDNRKSYQEMKGDRFYPFIVQASLDFISNKIRDKKFDFKTLTIDNNNGKTFDEYLRDNKGIDNVYGYATGQAVKLLQKIVGIQVDGQAGPDYFGKICAILKGETNIDVSHIGQYRDINNKVSTNNTNTTKLDQSQEIESVKKYSLSEEDYQKYFEGATFKQQNIGDCRLVAAIDSITHLGNYKELIKKSVKKISTSSPDEFKETGIFEVTLPLGAKNGKTYTINTEKFDGQIGTDGNEDANSTFSNLKLVSSDKIGLKALFYAAGCAIMGKDYFDITSLTGGRTSIAFNSLLSGMNLYSEISTPNKLKEVLQKFDPKKMCLTIGVLQGKELEDMYNRNNITKFGNGHAISVQKVEEKNGELCITLSNPHDPSKPYKKTFSELKRCCMHFDLVASDKFSFDSYTTKQPNEKKNLGGKEGTVGADIQDKGLRNDKLRKERGDVVVRKTEEGLYVSGRGYETKIDRDGNNIKMYFGKNILEIDENNLLTRYNGEESRRYPMVVYAPKIANFINRMRHNYIDPKKYDKKNPAPFRIKKGLLQFDDDPYTLSGVDKAKRIAKETLRDDYIECLKNRESLGIKPSDDNTKQKIVNLLNRLVKEKNNSI